MYYHGYQFVLVGNYFSNTIFFRNPSLFPSIPITAAVRCSS
jgi:hypothetical protein